MNKNRLFEKIKLKIIGFLIFLILFIMANIVAYYIKNYIYLLIVNFLNKNLWLIIAFVIVFLIGEIFNYLDFPLNIPYPLFNAAGGALFLQFIFNLLNLVLYYLTSFVIEEVNFERFLFKIESIAIIIIFIVMLVIGYYHLIKNISKSKKSPKKNL